MKYYINCRHCVSLGSEKLCSSCSQEGEDRLLPPIKEKAKRVKRLTQKQLFIAECVAKVKALSEEEVEF